jgi:hypothetical protein
MSNDSTPTTRRALLLGGAGLAAAALAKVATPLPVKAIDGDPVLLGTVNTSSTATVIAAEPGAYAALHLMASGQGLRAEAGGLPGSVGISAQSSGGHGVDALTDAGRAVDARAGGTGDGVVAYSKQGRALVASTGTGTALQVNGRPRFSWASKVIIRAGHRRVTKSMAGVRVGSQVFAVLRHYMSGTYVVAAEAAEGSFTIYLNRAAPSDISISYFVVN